MAHPDRGRALLLAVGDKLKEHGVIERMPLLEGRQMIMVMNPVRAVQVQNAPGGGPMPVAGVAAPVPPSPVPASSPPAPAARPAPVVPAAKAPAAAPAAPKSSSPAAAPATPAAPAPRATPARPATGKAVH
jgi:hypothetical protein